MPRNVKFLVISLLLYLLLDFPRNNSKYKLIIGIFSARENLQLRSTIRNSWKSLTHTFSLETYVLPVFIIGSKSCDIPPNYRLNEYGCEENFALRKPRKEKFYLGLSEYPSAQSWQLPYRNIGVDFEVAIPLTISSVLLPSLFIQDYKIQLWNVATQGLVFEFETTKLNCQDAENHCSQCDVEQITLPRGFIGSLVIDMNNDQQQLSPVFQILRPKYAVEFSEFIRYNEVVYGHFPMSIDTINRLNILPFSLGVTVEHDMKILPRQKDFNLQLKRNIEIDREIQKEQKIANDLVVLKDIDGNSDYIDTYANLSTKMRLFHRWTSENVEAEYIMKTDDDSFVDIPAILKYLTSIKPAPTFSWFGNFRTYWGVDRFGKWKESHYTSPAYPAFACGSGNIVTRDISKWIGRNVEHLHSYQGEDVSMGIWLSAINPIYNNDDRWHCSGVCSQGAFVIAQQKPENLNDLFQNYLQCSNPCGC